jgi:uncharacterized protein (UPF0276 family)
MGESLDTRKHDICGVGLGLRTPHLPVIFEQKPRVPWFEILVDNYFSDGGLALHNLERIRNNYPIVFHSVGMSLAGTDAINRGWFQHLRRLMDRFQPAWVSDHLCWTQFGGHHFHDLLPFPLNNASLGIVSDRVSQVQEILGQEILVENVSSYVSFTDSEMDEADFLHELCQKTGCYLLLDVNNIHVSAVNNKFDPLSYMERIPAAKVKQFHLAGFEDTGEYLLDSHSAPVWPAVWELYALAVARFGQIPTLIEWDSSIPDFAELFAEAEKARVILEAGK